MAFDPSLISIEQARDACEVKDQSQDELLRVLVLAATEWAEANTRPNLKSRLYSDTAGDEPALVLNGSGHRSIDIGYNPVSAVTKVEFLEGSTWTEVDLTASPIEIARDIPGRIFFRDVVFPWGYQNVRVTTTAGLVTIPGLLVTATRQAVLHLYRHPKRQGAGIASKTFDGTTTAYLNEALPKVTRALWDSGLARIAV